MNEVTQELMTPHETARWFRRSPSWLRKQNRLLRIGAASGQPLFHVRVCRAYVLGQLCELDEQHIRQVQIQALAAACGLTGDLLSLQTRSAQENAAPAKTTDAAA